MHVALLTPMYGPHGGGAGRMVQEVARHLAGAGERVDVILHTGEQTDAEEARRDGVNVRAFEPPIGGVDYALSPRLWDYMRRRAGTFDVVHVHGYRVLPAVMSFRASARSLVFSPYYHLVPVTRLRRVARQPYRQVARRIVAAADLAICVSGVEAAALRSSVPTLEGRIRVVPAAADAAAIRASEPYPTARTTIVAVGPLEHGKRIDRIISTLPDLGSGYEVVVIGRGPERRALAAHSADLGVAEQVRFVGPVEDAVLFRWLRTADVVVTMATEAMSGGTLLEAACAGAPIVASDIPAHLEIAGRLGHGAVRFVSSQSSPLALADEILAAVDTPRPPPDRWRVPSWEDAARETAGLYRHASDAGSRDGRAALS